MDVLVAAATDVSMDTLSDAGEEMDSAAAPDEQDDEQLAPHPLEHSSTENEGHKGDAARGAVEDVNQQVSKSP